MIANEATVFVLDDDTAIQDSLAQVLRVMQFQAEFYGTVAEFWEHYNRRPGCVLLDLRLPGDGFSVLERVRDEDHALPIIVITGHGDADTKQRAEQLGALAFYEKPFPIRELCDTIRTALDGGSAVEG